MNEDLIFFLAVEATSGKMNHKAAHDVIQVANGKSGLLKEYGLPVLDTEGNPLIKGERYLCKRGSKEVVALVQDAVFGCGNIADTYYRVHYLYGENMEEGIKVVGGKGDPFSGFVYQSTFKLIKESKGSK